MTPKRFIGANWKMNPPPQGFDAKDSAFRASTTVDVTVFPSCTDIAVCVRSGLTTGGQYGRAEDCGAFTGDVSMQQLKTAGCTSVLCGHSERRFHHEESDECVGKQVLSALKTGLTAILCIGENADERELGSTNDVLERQLTAALKIAGKSVTPQNFLVAYEPVWAIGTGNTPKPADVETTHAFIRSLLPSPEIRIIYGGSVTAKNAASFFALKNVDGALVGGASLKPEEFAGIVNAA